MRSGTLAELGALVEKVRSKNAGPFWVTIDIFCGSAAVFQQISDGVSTERVAKLFQTDVQALKRFDVPSLSVVKFSLPRPQVQGTRFDRDMHGASFAVLLAEMEVN